MAKVFASSTALLGSAQPGVAPPTQHQARKGIVKSIPKTNALLQTAAMVLLHGGSVERTVHMAFARQMGAIQALSKKACALSMVPTASARLTIARLLLI